MAEKGIRGGICHPIYQFAKKLSTTKVSKYIPLSFSVATISLVKNIENRHIEIDTGVIPIDTSLLIRHRNSTWKVR